MAITTLVATTAKRNVIPATDWATAALDATAGAEYTHDGKDENTVFILENADASNAEVVTIKAGNGIQGTTDLAISLPASAMRFITLDSGKYKNVSGTNKGKIMFTGTADVKIAVLKIV